MTSSKLAFAGRLLVHLLGAIGLLMLIGGQTYGLFLSPPDRMMGDVARILYVHVPSAQNGMLWLLFATLCALAYLLVDVVHWVGAIMGKPPSATVIDTLRRWLDHALEAGLEVGTILIMVLTLQGSIFAKPTWGVWWTWDPRLTSTAVMVFSFIGVLILRSLLQHRELRATITAAFTILAAVTLPITYFSVEMFRSIHQIQTNAADIDATMRLAWQVNFWALFLITVWFISHRWRIARANYKAGEAPPPARGGDMNPTSTTTTEPVEATPIVTGNLSGGWEYVYGAYGVTWLFLIGYALSLVIRRPRRGGSS